MKGKGTYDCKVAKQRKRNCITKVSPAPFLFLCPDLTPEREIESCSTSLVLRPIHRMWKRAWGTWQISGSVILFGVEKSHSSIANHYLVIAFLVCDSM